VLAKKWEIFGGSVLKYMTDKNYPMMQPARKRLFLQESWDKIQANTSKISFTPGYSIYLVNIAIPLHAIPLTRRWTALSK